MEGLPTEEQKAVLEAFAGALQEDAAQYRRDAEELESAAKETSGAVCCVLCSKFEMIHACYRGLIRMLQPPHMVFVEFCFADMSLVLSCLVMPRPHNRSTLHPPASG